MVETRRAMRTGGAGVARAARRAAAGLGLSLAAVSCVEGPVGPDGCLDDDPQTPCDEEETGLGGEPDDRRRVEDDCNLAPRVGAGRYVGTLFGADDEQGGACGLGGPDAFVRFDVGFRLDLEAQVRAEGFEPRVELRGNACPGGQALACGLAGEGALARDVPAGSEVLVVVGIDPASPALDGATRESLAFDLFLAVTPVLEAGAVCEPEELGRCVAGTTCAPATDPQAPARCREVAGDVCGPTLPELLIAPTMSGTFEATVAVDSALADEHVHSCGGAGQVDLVVRLELDPGLALDDTLVIEAEGVGLAVRSPWCDPSAELACAPADGGTASVQLDEVGARAASGERPLLFVDWPAGTMLPDEVTFDLSLVTG